MTESAKNYFQQIIDEIPQLAVVGELQKLNDLFFIMYGELKSHSADLGAERSEFVAEAIFEQYKAQYEIIQHRTEIKRIREHATHKERKNAFMPAWYKKHWFSRKATVPNAAQRTIEEEVGLEAQRYFAERDRWLTKMTDAFEEEFYPKNDGKVMTGGKPVEEPPEPAKDVAVEQEDDPLLKGGQERLTDGSGAAENADGENDDGDNGGNDNGEGSPEGD